MEEAPHLPELAGRLMGEDASRRVDEIELLLSERAVDAVIGSEQTAAGRKMQLIGKGMAETDVAAAENGVVAALAAQCSVHSLLASAVQPTDPRNID
jgi:hypothetical protein